MTSPIRRTGRDQAADGDPIVPDDRIGLDDRATAPADRDRAVLEDSAIPPGHDRAMTDDRAMTTGSHAMAPDDADQAMPGDNALAGQDPIAHGDRNAAVLGEERIAQDEDRMLLEDNAATRVPATAGRPAGAAHARSESASPGTRWSQIQVMFVDDPRASVELAASVVDDSVQALVVSVQERQHELLSGWQRNNPGTEELRTALQQYRTFWNRLQDFAGQS
jgi:hypothetical protein